jgi:hypothetical protein
MNKHDRDNLKFILSTYSQGEDAVKEWMKEVSEDDLMYALELLTQYHQAKDRFNLIVKNLLGD